MCFFGSFPLQSCQAIGEIAFGEQLQALEEKQTPVAEALKMLLLATQELLFVPFPYYKYIKTPVVRKIEHVSCVLSSNSNTCSDHLLTATST